MISLRARAHLAAAALSSGAAVLYRFPPERYAFYPPCPIYRLTHLYCPGCGATRALSALLHGRVAEALQYNALVTVLFPFLLAYFVSAYWTAIRHNRFDWPQLPARAARHLLATAALFTVLRNALHLSP